MSPVDNWWELIREQQEPANLQELPIFRRGPLCNPNRLSGGVDFTLPGNGLNSDRRRRTRPVPVVLDVSERFTPVERFGEEKAKQ